MITEDILANVEIPGPVPVYLQIERRIQYAIASERLRPGDKLPAVRELAESMGVTLATVARAYRELEVLESAYARRGLGAFVAPGAPEKCRAACRDRVGRGLQGVVADAALAGLEPGEIYAIARECYTVSGD